MPSGSKQYLAQSDQLKARPLGPSTLEKLFYIEKYCQAFVTAMTPKKRAGKWDKLVYLDLLAGPGRCIDTDTAEEYDGSALRALKLAPPFDHLFFSDNNKSNVSALRKRIPPADYGRVTIEQGDCNKLVGSFLSQINERTLGVALLDPQGFEIDFGTLLLLSEKRMDIIYLFPSGIGIARNLANFVKLKKVEWIPSGGRIGETFPLQSLQQGKW